MFGVGRDERGRGGFFVEPYKPVVLCPVCPGEEAVYGPSSVYVPRDIVYGRCLLLALVWGRGGSGFGVRILTLVCFDFPFGVVESKVDHWRYCGGHIFNDSCFNEHSVLELTDGRLWMLSRCHKEIAQSFSENGGRAWGPIETPARPRGHVAALGAPMVAPERPAAAQGRPAEANAVANQWRTQWQTTVANRRVRGFAVANCFLNTRDSTIKNSYF